MIVSERVNLLFALALFMMTMLANEALAQTNIDWDQSTGAWSDASRWVGGNIPDDATEAATLGGAGEYTVIYDFSSLTIGGLSITNPSSVLDISGVNGDRRISIGSDFVNAGELNLNSDGGGFGGIVDVTGTFTNEGSLSFAGATNTNIGRNRINADVVNTGTIAVDRNGFINGDLTNDGTINVAEGSTLSFAVNNTINQNSGSLNFAAAATRLDNTTLNFNGGEITGEDITLENSTLNLAAGITRSFNLESVNTVTIDGPSNLTFNLNATGSSDSRVELGTDFVNAGELNLNSDGGGFGGIVDVTGTFTNEGSLSFAGATNTNIGRNRINADVVNTGTIAVDRNGFINGDLTNDGTINVAEGSTLSFAVNTTINQNSGSLNFAAAATRLDNTTLNFNGGEITGEDITLENSTLNLAAGITRSFNLESVNTVTIDGPSNLTFNLNATGSSDSRVELGTDFVNAGELNLNSDGGGFGGIVDVTGTFTNEGSLSFAGATNTNIGRNRINADVVNTGTIAVDRNGFINGDLTNDGTINVAEGSTLSFAVNNTINQNSGSLNFAAAATRLDNTTLNFNGGEITGEDITLENSTLNLAAGITRSFNLESVNTVTIDGPSNLTFNLNATGSSDSRVELGTDFVNAGELNLNSDGGGFGGIVDVTGTFTNEGSLSFAGATNTNIGRNRINADVVNTGTIAVDRDGFINGDLTNDGTINVAEGSTFRTNGTFTSGSGGVLTGEGDFAFDAVSQLLLGGTVSPGDQIGQLTFSSDIQFEEFAVLAIELGGTTQVDQYDLFFGNGDIDLDGLLSVSLVDGFLNSIQETDEFTILSADGSLTGIFSGIADGGTLLTNDGTFTVNYTGNSVVLSEFTAVAIPEPTSIALLTSLLAVISLRRQKRLTSGLVRRAS